MQTPPTTESLLEILARNSAVPLDELRRHRGGRLYDLPPHVIQPARPDAQAKFDIIPDDIRAQLAEVRVETIHHGHYVSNGGRFTHRLSVRRQRNVMNTVVPQLARTRGKYPANPAWLHPDDMTAIGVADGEVVTIVSDSGSVAASVKADETVKPGVLSISHGYGGKGEDADDRIGSNVNLLISTSRDLDEITAMVRMSAVPVRIEKREAEEALASAHPPVYST